MSGQLSNRPGSSDASMTAEIHDVSGITVHGKTADTARLISQFGIPTVLISVFLVIFVAGLWLVRGDFLRQDAERTEAHERSIKSMNETYLKIHSERREDDKERTRDLKEAQGKMWQELRSITEATKEGNKLVQDAARALILTAEEMKKVAKKME